MEGRGLLMPILGAEARSRGSPLLKVVLPSLFPDRSALGEGSGLLTTEEPWLTGLAIKLLALLDSVNLCLGASSLTDPVL